MQNMMFASPFFFLPDDLPYRATGRRTILSRPRAPCLTQWRTSGGWCGSGGVIQSLCSPSSKRGSRYSTRRGWREEFQILVCFVILLFSSLGLVCVCVFVFFSWNMESKMALKWWTSEFHSDFSSGKVLPVLATRGQCYIWRLHRGADCRHAVWDLQCQRPGAHLQASTCWLNKGV